MKPKKIGITGRKENSLARLFAQKAIAILESKGIAVEIDSAFLPRSKGKTLSKFSCDLVLSFGGDGTLLSVYRELAKKIPVMGINCGSVGFLQAYKNTELEEATEAIASGKFAIEKRTRVAAKIDGKIAGEALNEALLVPAKAGRILKYRLAINGHERDEAGDGLIVATPTGSTAHALSAGGPIVKGNANVFVVVSINPVNWQHRPLIINDHEKVRAYAFQKINAELILDGQTRFPIKKMVELSKGSEVLLATK
ncbi:MAG: NAD(+)/NADH kinase [archaeon]|nr:NAD(+)/NADH kinase [archaeon]